MITRILEKIFGSANERTLKSFAPLVAQINALEPSMQSLSDEQLSAKTDEFRTQIKQGATLDDLLPAAFAVVREASRRKLGQRHYDVQLIGGIALHRGMIAEMKTGEGKTLTATLPLYLNALTGKGAHLVTVNDYLARRDAAWMGQIFTFLNLTVGCLQNSMNDQERREAYDCDILYATNNELGFDYLRDNMKFRLEDYVQRDLVYAIVDEVDSILIDEARTPLIISGSTEDSSRLYVHADKVVSHLVQGQDYEVNKKDRQVQLTEQGNDKVERAFNIKNLYDIEHLMLLHHINQALRAHALFRRDVDYVVKDDELLIVDEFTGRILAGRRYSDGLHQALEAKEGVTINEETQTLAAITLQNFFRMYKKLAGMTGTATTEAEEFHSIYKLEVLSIPTHKPMIRIDKPDLVFLSNKTKYEEIAKDVKERHQKGQPILIGTVAIETSELLSKLLTINGVAHNVLNAKQHEREADIVENAGLPGKVTIATNMAGRGTDIKLTPEAIQSGGLYILGTERHESRRIDNQLRGRSGRQGDPGESRFYISLHDSLIEAFAGDNIKRMMERVGMKEDEVIEDSRVSRAIEHAQKKVEKYYQQTREELLKYDEVLNQQRIVIYQYRREALEGADAVTERINDFIAKVVQQMVSHRVQGRSVDAQARQNICTDISQLINKPFEFAEGTADREQYTHELTNHVVSAYQQIRNNVDHEKISTGEKWTLLQTIDHAWKQHMLNLDHLKEGISLRSWGQKNPLIEYKREAFDMFSEMMMAIAYQVVFNVFRPERYVVDEHALEAQRKKELQDLHMVSNHEDEGETEPAKAAERTGRNELCPCGSGKKYKKCHGK